MSVIIFFHEVKTTRVASRPARQRTKYHKDDNVQKLQVFWKINILLSVPFQFSYIAVFCIPKMIKTFDPACILLYSASQRELPTVSVFSVNIDRKPEARQLYYQEGNNMA